MKRDQMPLDYQSPDLRFGKAIQTARSIKSIQAPAAKHLVIKQLIRELKDAIGGPKRVA